MYKILEADNKEELEKLVNEHRKNRYNLVGGVSCSLCESDEYFYITYAQAVEKEESKLPYELKLVDEYVPYYESN